MGRGLQDSGQQIQQYSQDNPGVDQLTNGSVSTLGLLIWAVGSTLTNLFQVKKTRQLTEVLEQAETAKNSPPLKDQVNTVSAIRTVKRVIGS